MWKTQTPKLSKLSCFRLKGEFFLFLITSHNAAGIWLSQLLILPSSLRMHEFGTAVASQRKRTNCLAWEGIEMRDRNAASKKLAKKHSVAVNFSEVESQRTRGALSLFLRAPNECVSSLPTSWVEFHSNPIWELRLLYPHICMGCLFCSLTHFLSN